MKIGSSLRWAACLLLLSATGIAQPTQAGDRSDPAMAARRPPPINTQFTDGALSQRGTGAPSTEPPVASVDPECDGRVQPAGVLTHLLNRLKGQAIPEDTRLCPAFPEEGTENGLHE
jgi:hypothetical protein